MTTQSFTFGSTAGGKLGDSSTEPLPLHLGLGKAADAAASAGNVMGHLFGFSAADSTKARSGFGGGGGMFGGLGSGFSFAAGHSSAGAPSGVTCCTRGIAAKAAKEDDGQEEEENTAAGEEDVLPEEGGVQGENEASGAEGEGEDRADATGNPQTSASNDTQKDTVQEAEGEEDNDGAALPDDLLSGDADAVAGATMESDGVESGADGDGGDDADEGSGRHSESGIDGGLQGDGSQAGQDGESSEHGEEDTPHDGQGVTGQE